MWCNKLKYTLLCARLCTSWLHAKNDALKSSSKASSMIHHIEAEMFCWWFLIFKLICFIHTSLYSTSKASLTPPPIQVRRFHRCQCSSASPRRRRCCRSTSPRGWRWCSSERTAIVQLRLPNKTMTMLKLRLLPLQQDDDGAEGIKALWQRKILQNHFSI